MRRFALTCSVLLALACAACTKPEPPDTERPPEPQAQPAEQPQQTQLRDAMQAPLEKAQGVEDQVLNAAKEQQAQIDAQTGG